MRILRAICNLFGRFFSYCSNKSEESLLEFQPDRVQLEERAVPFAVRWTLHLLILLVFTGVLLSVLITTDKIVTATGKLESQAKTILIQPLAQGVITELDVEEGQEVQKDQLLVKMDPTFAQSDMERVRSRLRSIKLQSERLNAMKANKPYVPEDPSDPDQSLQMQIFKQRMAEFKSASLSYDNAISQLKAQIQTKKTQLKYNLDQLNIGRDMEKMYSTIFKRGAISRMEFLKAQSKFSEQNEMVNRIQNELTELQFEFARQCSDREAYIGKWHSQLIEEQVEVNRELKSLRKEFEKAGRLWELVQLRAPAHAVILEVGNFSVGSVVEEAQTIMSLVPLDFPIEAEVYIRAQDIGFVRKGDPVRIKLSSFPYEEHGTVNGTVISLSEDAFQQDRGGSTVTTYKAKVSLGEVSLRNVPSDYRVIPGMTLTAEIKVGKRRLITYFLYPLIRSFDESMREP